MIRPAAAKPQPTVLSTYRFRVFNLYRFKYNQYLHGMYVCTHLLFVFVFLDIYVFLKTQGTSPGQRLW